MFNNGIENISMLLSIFTVRINFVPVNVKQIVVYIIKIALTKVSVIYINRVTVIEIALQRQINNVEVNNAVIASAER